MFRPKTRRQSLTVTACHSHDDSSPHSMVVSSFSSLRVVMSSYDSGVSTPMPMRSRGSNLPSQRRKIHTIFEGTSEIQQLVIARAISGMRVE